VEGDRDPKLTFCCRSKRWRRDHDDDDDDDATYCTYRCVLLSVPL